MNPPLQRLYKKFRSSRQNEMEQGVSNISDVIAKNIAEETPRKTGKLLRSQRLLKRGKLNRELIEGEPYGAILRAGVPASRRNPIVPVRAKALASADGTFGPVAIVLNHPGIKPNDYWTKGIEKSQGDIDKESKAIGAEIAAKYKV